MNNDIPANVREILTGAYGERVVSFVESKGLRVRTLRDGERYSQASPILERLAPRVDSWPIPPVGLFVVDENTIYLRSISPMIVTHEFGHALDRALGGGAYLSGFDPKIRRAFANATAFVTPYAAAACDEYFAESVRAYSGLNDPISLWPKATRERLQEVDSTMFAIVRDLFESIDPHPFVDEVEGSNGLLGITEEEYNDGK